MWGVSRHALPRAQPALVIALHCSGGSPRQWRRLRECLTEDTLTFVAPSLYGAIDGAFWSGARAFRLADETEPILEMIDAHDGPVHLVGHSYGGAVALRAASERRDRIASLSLFEPSAFHMLPRMGGLAQDAFIEIVTLADEVRDGLVSGAYQVAAERFVDYWNGPGAWASQRQDVQSELARYVPKACLDFNALINETTVLDSYTGFAFPVLAMRGSEGPEPTRLIARRLAELAPQGRYIELQGAGHMGPLTHGDAVTDLIARNVAQADRIRQPHQTAA
jgi:pimeloyl-ACP methyl ester carboxylesterase